MSRTPERRGLGRGLSALLGDIEEVDTAGPGADGAASAAAARPAAVLPIERIRSNPDQPRRDFAERELNELAESIRQRGIIQPVVVRPDPRHPGDYQLVAGERRWRAAQRAQLHEVPVVVRELDDRTVLEVAIIENVQRTDLNPVEEAAGYAQLIERFGHTQEKLAEALGKSRSHIANLLRLLNLPDEVLAFLREGKLSMGHARALITADEPESLARKVVKEGLSVRQTEKLVAKPKGGESPKPAQRPSGKTEKDADTKALEADLSAATGMTVTVDHRAGGEAGEVRISYKDFDDLDAICQLLNGGR